MNGERLRVSERSLAWIGVTLMTLTFQAVFLCEAPATGVKIALALGTGKSLEQVQALIEQGRQLLYNSTMMEEFSKGKTLLEQAKGGLKALIEKDQNNPLSFYCLAKVEFELGNWYAIKIKEVDHKEDRRKAAEQFELAWRVAERSVQMNEAFSDSHRLVGEAIMRLIGFKGWWFAAANNSKAKQEIQRAIQLDPKNAQAHKALGLWYIFTPRMFGGNLDKAMGALQRAEQLATDDHVRFLANIWLGQAFLKKEDKPKAKSHFQKALEIYSNSGWAKSLLAAM